MNQSQRPSFAVRIRHALVALFGGARSEQRSGSTGSAEPDSSELPVARSELQANTQSNRAASSASSIVLDGNAKVGQIINGDMYIHSQVIDMRGDDFTASSGGQMTDRVIDGNVHVNSQVIQMRGGRSARGDRPRGRGKVFINGVDVFDSAVCKGQAQATSQSRPVGQFTELRVELPAEIIVDAGSNADSVELHGSHEALACVATDHNGEILTIRRAPGAGNMHGPLTIHLSQTLLAAVTATTACAVRIRNLSAETFQARYSGASTLEVAGKVGAFILEGSGAGSIDASGLQAHRVSIGVSGASNVAVHACDAIEGSVSGVSKILVSGQPRVRHVRTSGLANVRYR